MADFAANLMSNSAFTFANAEGGTVPAQFFAATAVLTGAVGSGTIDVNFMANTALIPSNTGGGTVLAEILSVPTVLAGNAGGGSIAGLAMYFGDSMFVNRVFDSVANKFITWPSIIPDRAGTRYPGPGLFGVTTSGYVVLSY